VLISGLLGVEDQATTVLIMNIILIGYMFATGLESAACTLIGNQIGSLNLNSAKKFMGTIAWVSALTILTSNLILYLFNHQLIYFLTKQQSLRISVERVIWIICLCMFPDMYKGMLKGVIKALGI
jgi:Na+-driven multidrug efflux pump